MPHPRPTPFDLVFEPMAQTTFPPIRAALHREGYDPRNRDAFLMVREVVALLRELRPAEGLGEGIDQLTALVQHAYLYWDAGAHIVEVSSGQLPELAGSSPAASVEDPVEQPAYYAQMPERRIWAQVIPGEPHEPLDGCFVHALPDASGLRVLGVFGIHPERQGFSVVEATGPRPDALAREDGSGLFTPVLPGGAQARLFSLTGEEELLELGWRSRALATVASAEAVRWRA
jgi:hypothetical protein